MEEFLRILIAGAAGSVLVNLIKCDLRLKGTKAYFLAFAVLFFITVIVRILVLGVHVPITEDPVQFFSDIGKEFSLIFTTATTIYRIFKKKFDTYTCA